MIVEQFIKLGWHTVPMLGELKRDPNTGKKIVGTGNFEKNWRDTYSKNFNKTPTLLAGVITGSQSNMIAIDCDDQVTYNIFKSLDPSYEFVFESVGKPSGGATIIYKYDGDIFTYSRTDGLKLDVFAEEGFIFLPTENNHTKAWKHEATPELKEMPPEVKSLLVSLSKKEREVQTVEKKSGYTGRLAPRVRTFLNNKGIYDDKLFKVLTPHKYRARDSYKQFGHMNPNEISSGEGSDYLAKVSCILGADVSISVEDYTAAITAINNLWDEPMPEDRLRTTIINPMLEQRTTIAGKVVWKYDKDWEKQGFIVTAANNSILESFYDNIKGLYYIVNYTEDYVHVHTNKGECVEEITSMTCDVLTKPAYNQMKALVRTERDPSSDFGHMESIGNMRRFNLFKASPGLTVINNPSLYSNKYKYPTATMEYFKSFIPDEETRNYILSFMRTKFTTFDFSPVIMYFIGAHGSGKDLFVETIGKIIGDDQIEKPGPGSFLEKFNEFMIDKFFIHLDEFGHALNSRTERQQALGVLKRVSGSRKMQIRPMRQKAFTYDHNITFIMTSNKNPLPIEDGDRRIALVRTPNKLEHEEWVKRTGGINAAVDKIKAEHLDFCYYLATKVENLTRDAYTTPPDTEDKRRLITDNLPAYERIIYMLKARKYKELAQLAVDHNIDNFTNLWSKSKMDKARLVDLYLSITEGHGSENSLIKAMAEADFKAQRSTDRNNHAINYYTLSGLKEAKAEMDREVHFKSIEDAKEAREAAEAEKPQQDLNI